MTKDIFDEVKINPERKEVGKPVNIDEVETTTKSTKPLSEILKGIKKVGGKSDVDINVNNNVGEGVLIVLLDTSSSMCARFETSTRIETANSVLRTQLIPNMSNWKFGIIKFGGTPVWHISPERQKTSLMINIPAIGGTAMMTGLKMAWNWIRLQSKGCRIILISDGEPTDASKHVILEAATMNKNVPIDTVGIGDSSLYSGYDPIFLRRISGITGGIFCEAHTIKQLMTVIHKLSPVERPLLGSGTKK